MSETWWHDLEAGETRTLNILIDSKMENGEYGIFEYHGIRFEGADDNETIENDMGELKRGTEKLIEYVEEDAIRDNRRVNGMETVSLRVQIERDLAELCDIEEIENATSEVDCVVEIKETVNDPGKSTVGPAA